MKIVVCVRQSTSGELNPFDACAYEAALRIPDAHVTLLSMAAPKTAAFLTGLTRLGAARSILLADTAFAGADTLATAYTLSLAVKKLEPDLIICGKQTVDGDTGQVGPELSQMTGYTFIPNVMALQAQPDKICCEQRDGQTASAAYPALITVERINTLRLPSIRSKTVQTEIWNAEYLCADTARCGLSGSPTRVIKTFENDADRRNCRFISLSDLPAAIEEGLKKGQKRIAPIKTSPHMLKRVWIVGESPRTMAETISDDITVIPIDTPQNIADRIRADMPAAVLWGSDPQSKEIAPKVAAILQTGLCADCTALETDGSELFMYRPAFSGNIIAKIRCLTRPQMATVRTLQSQRSSIIVGIGAGAKSCLDAVKAFAEAIGADTAASRLMVDNDYMPYEKQVGLTGKSVNPDVYIAAGISGAIHHIAGIKSSGTIIAVNNDQNADIFKYADYGIVADIHDLVRDTAAYTAI